MANQLDTCAFSQSDFPLNVPSLSYLSAMYRRQALLSNTVAREPSVASASSNAGTILSGLMCANHRSVWQETTSMWWGIWRHSISMRGFTTLFPEVGVAFGRVSLWVDKMARYGSYLGPRIGLEHPWRCVGVPILCRASHAVVYRLQMCHTGRWSRGRDSIG